MPIYHHKNWKEVDLNDLNYGEPNNVEPQKQSKIPLILYMISSSLLIVSGVVTITLSSILLYKKIMDDSNTLMLVVVIFTGIQIIMGFILIMLVVLGKKLQMHPHTVRSGKLLCVVALLVIGLNSLTQIFLSINLRNQISDCTEDSCVKNKNAFDNMEFLYLVNSFAIIATIVFVSINTCGCQCKKTSLGIYCCESTEYFDRGPTYGYGNGYAERAAIEGCCLLSTMAVTKVLCAVVK